MGPQDPPEVAAFRTRVRQFIAENLSPELRRGDRGRGVFDQHQSVQDEHPGKLEAIEDQLFGAMFRELRDISDPEELRACARGAGVPEELVGRALADASLRERVFAEHQEALEEGVRGIPALVVPGYAPITGAVPLDLMRRAFAGVLDEHAGHP